MMQSSASIPAAPQRRSLYWDALGVVIGLITLGITWLLRDFPINVMHPSNPLDIYLMAPEAGIAIYTLLYAILSLLAYRLPFGMYVGFQHVAAAAAFLSLGPVATIIIVFVGSGVAEIGRLIGSRWLDLHPHSLRAAVVGLFYYAGAHGYSVALAGLLYEALSGDIPLLSFDVHHILPLTIFFVVQVGLYELMIATGLVVVQQSISYRKLGHLLPVVIISKLLALPLAILLSISYYEFPPLAFLLLIGASVMGAVLFRASERARWSLIRRVEELATLNSIGQSIASSLDMNDLIQSIYNQVIRLMDVQTFYIALHAADTQTLTFSFVIQNGQPVSWQPRQSENDLSDYIIRTGQPLLLSGSIKAEAAKLGIRTLEEEAASYVGVPLSAGDEVLGVLVVKNTLRAHAYGPAEVSVLTTIAAQAAVALRNASLYNRVWEMADELALLNNVSSVVTATLDLDIVLDTACTVITQVGRADKTGIFLTADDGMTLRLVHHIGLSEDFVAQFQNVRRDDDSGPTQVMRQTSAMAISDVMTDARGLGWRTLAEVEGYTSLLTVPLIASDQVIGFLAAFYQQTHLFGKSELDLMNTLANQVAVTVANARLHKDTEDRARDMERLVEASRAFTASLDLNSVAQRVVDELATVLAPDLVALMLISPNGDVLRPLAHRGIATMDAMGLTGSVAESVMSGKPSILPNNSEDLALLRWLELQSLYVLPLVSQENVIGCVLIGHEIARPFSLRDRQLAEALVNHAATAVRNAQLYGQTDAALSARVAELSAVEAISRQISGALDLDSIINDVLDTALGVTQADAAGCGLVIDPDHISYTERYAKVHNMLPTTRIMLRGTGMVGQVLSTGDTIRMGDVRNNSHDLVGSVTGILSTLCVPINHKQERVGMINLESRRPDAFSPLHERFLVNLADHAAIAIENARLFQERQTQIDTLIKFRNLSLELLTANSLKEVMSLIVEYALIITHGKDAQLYLYDRSTDMLSFGGSLWLDGRENVEAGKPKREGRTWQVARTGQIHLIEDTSKLQPPPQFRTGPGFGAIVRMPLKRSGQVIGVLIIAFRDAHFFSENELRALDLLANQAAIAIENARLFDEVRTGHDRMQAILNSARDGMVLIDATNQIMLANLAAERLLQYPAKEMMGRDLLRGIVTAHKKGIAPDPALKLLHLILADVKKSPSEIRQQNFELPAAGGIRDVEATLLPVQDTTGKIAARLLVLRDISEEKSMERFREEVTNMIVHDLRSPLSAIISSLRLVQDMVTTKDFTDLDQVLSIAITSSENQMRMIESMLEIDKLETGHMPMHLDSWDLRPIVSKAIEALDVLAQVANIRIVDCLPPELPPLRIDEEQIRRVITNLLDNAVRHTPSNGEIRIEGAMYNGKGFAKIGVIDTGKGISAELRERVFEKFVQLPKSALRGHRGSGLGLTFCKLSIEAHGGRIWVDSGPEGGAAFWFTLPIA